LTLTFTHDWSDDVAIAASLDINKLDQPILELIFPKGIKLLHAYVSGHFVDAMQVFNGIICKKLLVLIIAGE